MRKIALILMVLGVLAGCATSVQEQRATLDRAAASLGAVEVKSIEYSGSGTWGQLGQSATPGQAWPKFNLPSYTRTVSYESASIRDIFVRTQAENPPRGGGGQPIRGELRQAFFASGEHAWNVVNDAPVSAGITLAERQLQLWTTPHGFLKAAVARGATVSGRTISLAVPGRYTARGFLNADGLLEKVEARVANPVVGDMPVEITCADYRQFGPVKFPARITQRHSGFPTLDLTVTDVKVNVPLDIPAPEPVRQAGAMYRTVKSDKVADGVWYVTGGTHHSVVLEMTDHVIVVEGPLNDERALAVIAETRRIVPSKPIRYVIATHHHFDHSGGLRAFAGEGITIVSSQPARAYLERELNVRATVAPDHLAKSGRRATVEAVTGKRTFSDGARVVEVLHITDTMHSDDLIMVYLPREKFLIEADAYTPMAAGFVLPAGAPAHPAQVNLADNITRLNLAVDQILPIHGRMVPLVESAPGDRTRAVRR
jgi:glyoxylase-like metal-dependent hydrolase (beta-lactamase superfamily II)